MKQVGGDVAERNRTQYRLGDTAILAEAALGDVGSLTGVLDVVPAFGSTAVHFDPTLTTGEAVTDWIANQSIELASIESQEIVELPVIYDGSDLDGIAKQSGHSVGEVIRRHSTAKYTVGAVGFQPGFPYLEGLPTELHTPRLETPRTRVPAGSVGIGGPYTGIYPAESPGGWNLIGRTPLTLFDEHRTEPSLLRAGDRVQFRPIDAGEFDRLAEANRPKPIPQVTTPERPLFRVLSPGVQTTAQSLGRYGLQHLGVSPGGAMDFASLRIANLLSGNRPDAPAIEATLVGPVLECLSPVTVAVSGAVPAAATHRLTPGKQLDLRQLIGGARTYLALPGGVQFPTGRPLKEDDLIGSADNRAVDQANATPPSSLRIGRIGWQKSRPPVLRVLCGPHASFFDDSAWQRLLNEPFRVAAHSNRMGLRCEGPALPCPGTSDLPSQPVATGVIQIPPDGQPIVLGADRQTLGGYPVIAAVVSADWPKLGQLRPGDTMRFAEVDLPEAIRLRQQLERELAIAAFGIRLNA